MNDSTRHLEMLILRLSIISEEVISVLCQRNMDSVGKYYSLGTSAFLSFWMLLSLLKLIRKQKLDPFSKCLTPSKIITVVNMGCQK